MTPRSLTYFVMLIADIDTYRDAVYAGGIPASRYLTDWFARVQKSSPKWKDHMNLVDLMNAHPFYEPLWDMVSAKTDQKDIPCFLAASQIFIIHGRGAYEAWRQRSPDNTHLQLVDCDYYPWPSREASGKILEFLGHHLKGHQSSLEKVGIQMRLGWKNWYWRKERNWPVPGTEYTKWHLASNGSLARAPPRTPEQQISYPSTVPATGKSGVSFYSGELAHDIELAGHFATVLTVSTSATDADVVATLWSVDENGKVVSYGSSDQVEPIVKGFLRASHRKLDPAKTLPERPWHTHTKQDNQPLRRHEVVELQIEMFPAAARVRRGWKLRLDITPSEKQPDINGYEPKDMREWYGESQGSGFDTLHIGSERRNYIMCPVVPVKFGYPNIVM